MDLHRNDRALQGAYQKLKKGTARGKHVGRFSYYHTTLLAQMPEVFDHLDSLRQDCHAESFAFNVVKLDAGTRISFLHYESFDTPFPSLLAALTCNLDRRDARLTNYTTRRNPPILHRKELLLPKNDPRVAEATRLTEHLERLGAFRNPATIGTRDGWQRRLLSLGLDPSGSPPP